MKKSYVIVEHRNSVAFNNLKSKVNYLTSENDKLKSRLRETEHLLGDEIYYNSALVDILKARGISFREVFSHEYRKSK